MCPKGRQAKKVITVLILYRIAELLKRSTSEKDTLQGVGVGQPDKVFYEEDIFDRKGDRFT